LEACHYLRQGHTDAFLHGHGARRRRGGRRVPGALPHLQERQDRAPQPASDPPRRPRRGHRGHLQGRRPGRRNRPLSAPLPPEAPGAVQEAPRPRLLPRRCVPARVSRLRHVPHLRQPPRGRVGRPRGVRELPPGAGAPAPGGLRGLLGRAPVGGVGGGRVDRRARQRGAPFPRRRQRRRQHRARHAAEGLRQRRAAHRGRHHAPPVVRREHAPRGGARERFSGHRWALDVRVPGRGRRRRRPQDEPAGARRAAAGEARVRADAGVRREEGRALRAGPRVLRSRGGQRVARGRGVARVRGGGACLLPSEARVRERQDSHGPRRGLHSRSLICSACALAA